MFLRCTICCERIVPRVSIVATSCGHIYHKTCILHWLINKNTCPQCRIKVKSTPANVYLNFVSLTEEQKRDKSEELNQKVQLMQQEEKTLEKEVRNHNTECSELRAQFLDIEAKLSEKRSQIQSMKRQIGINKTLKADYCKKKMEFKYVKGQLANFSRESEAIKNVTNEVAKLKLTVPFSDQNFSHIKTYIEAQLDQLAKTDDWHQSLSDDTTKIDSEIKKLESAISQSRRGYRALKQESMQKSFSDEYHKKEIMQLLENHRLNSEAGPWNSVDSVVTSGLNRWKSLFRRDWATYEPRDPSVTLLHETFIPKPHIQSNLLPRNRTEKSDDDIQIIQ